MSKLPTLTREQRIYLALWRKGYQAKLSGGEPISLNASSYATALSIRSGMYKAIRPYRDGEAFDADLCQAAEHCVVTAVKAEGSLPPRVLIRPRASLLDLEAELSSLGISEADIGAEASAVPLPPIELSDPATIQPKRPGNPFFTRED